MYKILQLDLVVGIILDLQVPSLRFLFCLTNPEHDNLNFDYLYFALTASPSEPALWNSGSIQRLNFELHFFLLVKKHVDKYKAKKEIHRHFERLKSRIQ